MFWQILNVFLLRLAFQKHLASVLCHFLNKNDTFGKFFSKSLLLLLRDK